jgi:hypothetical protein
MGATIHHRRRARLVSSCSRAFFSVSTSLMVWQPSWFFARLFSGFPLSVLFVSVSVVFPEVPKSRGGTVPLYRRIITDTNPFDASSQLCVPVRRTDSFHEQGPFISRARLRSQRKEDGVLFRAARAEKRKDAPLLAALLHEPGDSVRRTHFSNSRAAI